MRRRFPAGVLAAVALGGAAGTLLRALVAEQLTSGSAGFPWATFAVNVAGSMVLGFVVVSSVERAVPTRYLRALLGTGLCGGLTTFSTFAVEADLLVKAGRVGTAAVYVVGSLAAGLAGARLGMLTARLAWRVALAPSQGPRRRS